MRIERVNASELCWAWRNHFTHLNHLAYIYLGLQVSPPTLRSLIDFSGPEPALGTSELLSKYLADKSTH